jgi:hypothetical protein
VVNFTNISKKGFYLNYLLPKKYKPKMKVQIIAHIAFMQKAAPKMLVKLAPAFLHQASFVAERNIG